jgi:hypothetical protein
MTKAREDKRRSNLNRGERSGPHGNDSNYKRYKKYKLTQDDYVRMIADQQGCCAICHSEPSMLVVDHDHATGVVRGLLCRNCNLGIGLLRDDIDLLRSAVQYLTVCGSSAA